MRFRLIALVGAAALTGGMLAGTATAAPSRATATCSVDVGSVTAGGDHRIQTIAATVPPTRTRDQKYALEAFPPGQVRLSTSMLADADASGPDVTGYVVIGSALYAASYQGTWVTPEVTHAGLTRIGGGWGNFTALEDSTYVLSDGAPVRRNAYGLRSDGVLFRWTLDPHSGLPTVWRGKTSYPGFAAVKAMTLISKTHTYDTFLATTRGGALYTIHIPTTTPMKPVVRLVRRATWQGFESLIATGCGIYGTLLLGIDKDTHTGYLYAVGHANGLTTIIQSRGTVPVTFDDPVYFRWYLPIDHMFGE